MLGLPSHHRKKEYVLKIISTDYIKQQLNNNID